MLSYLEFFSHPYMTIQTPAEIPCRVDKKNAVFLNI
jgi:hypothetical protein